MGPAFLVFRNFDVISRYNNAQAYMIGVGHLGDRLRGIGPLQVSFPAGERDLFRAERRELQQRLTAARFNTSGYRRQGWQASSITSCENNVSYSPTNTSEGANVCLIAFRDRV